MWGEKTSKSHEKYFSATIKHGWGSIIVLSRLAPIEEMMASNKYQQILKGSISLWWNTRWMQDIYTTIIILHAPQTLLWTSSRGASWHFLNDLHSPFTWKKISSCKMPQESNRPQLIFSSYKTLFLFLFNNLICNPRAVLLLILQLPSLASSLVLFLSL